MRRVRLLTAICVVVALGIFVAKNRGGANTAESAELVLDPSWLSQGGSILTPEADRRPADQTFLTFPEWYLVFSPAEQAEYARTDTMTTFPLMSHVNQVWDSYGAISTQIAPYFEYNEEYHFMIQFIGVSTSVEYRLKTVYETLIGRLTNTANTEPLTAEDQFNASYLQEYVEFLAQQPWYNFNYANQLRRLWLETDYIGPNMLRKLERRYFLSTELLAKIAYAKLVAAGAGSIYGEVDRSTVVVLDRFPADLEQDEELQLERKFDDGSVLVRLPRYAAFNPAAARLAEAGVTFREIAGNDSAILLTVLLDNDDSLPETGEAVRLFDQESQSATSRTRVGLVTSVPLLARVLNELVSRGIEIEHIYDY